MEKYLEKINLVLSKYNIENTLLQLNFIKEKPMLLKGKVLIKDFINFTKFESSESLEFTGRIHIWILNNVVFLDVHQIEFNNKNSWITHRCVIIEDICSIVYHGIIVQYIEPKDFYTVLYTLVKESYEYTRKETEFSIKYVWIK